MSIQNFPLYDLLLSKVNQRVDKTIDTKMICVTINDIANNLSPAEASVHYTMLTALMYHHELLHRTVLLTTAPYEGKIMVGGKGILYTISLLPPLLQQIIAQYIDEFSKPDDK